MKITMTALAAAGAITIGALVLSTGARAAEDDTSAVCFNAGLLKKGASVDYDLKISGNQATPPRRQVLDVLGTKNFNGVDAIETRINFFGDDGELASTEFKYSGIKNNNVLEYGRDTLARLREFRPAIKLPMAMELDETNQADYKIVTIVKGEVFKKQKVLSNIAFKGIETVKFKIGKLKACRFDSKIYTQIKGDKGYYVRMTEWVAAEGKYRGFSLKINSVGKFTATGEKLKQISEVTAIRKFDVK